VSVDLMVSEAPGGPAAARDTASQANRGATAMPRGKSRWGAAALALLALSLSPGCLRFCHPVEAPPPEEAACHELPQACKNHVYVFFVHGLDPLDLANLSGVNDHVRSLGFIKTYYGQPFHVYHFAGELRKVHECDPEARFVLVGFSYGAGLARDLAGAVEKDGIAVDLLIYIDGARLEASPLTSPPNVVRVVNVLGPDRDDNANVPGAENHVVDDVWHFGTPTHPQTLRILEQELGAVAERVPVVQTLPVTGPGAMPVLPPPLPAGWGFLRPDGHARGAERPPPMADASQQSAVSGQRSAKGW